MPAMAAEHAQRRVEKLADGIDEAGTLEMLRTLAEVRYYASQDLLSADQAAALYRRILGRDRGAALASGTESERREALQNWLGRE
jgi:hypothetical protein